MNVLAPPADRLIETRYVVITADGFRSEHVVQWPEEPGYKQLSATILPHLRAVRPGAHLEHVGVLFEGKPADMFVDDMGVIVELEVNPEATKIYRANWLRRHPQVHPDTMPAIHGPAVLFRRRVWF